MTPNRRIALNIFATYGRSIYSLVVGLICGRWTLMSLGAVDYGLVGLVGGLTGVVSFLNSLLATSVGRFYALEVGAAQKAGNEVAGLENCRRWFNTALSIHTTIPLLLMVVGYPCGVWAVEHFLTIPPDRISVCIWVWRFSCLACFMSMFNVPFQAMYTAKQEIAELTVYSFATTTANALFLFYMVNHPGVWLTRYVAWTCALGVVPQMIITVRALLKYKECRFVFGYWWDLERYKALVKYAIARFWSSFSTTVAIQGQSILVNKYMGTVYNASMTVGNNLAYRSMTFSGSISAAFWPAITNKAGEGKLDEMRNLSFTVCRLGTVMMLIFAIPLFLEVDEVLLLWLKNPPPFAAEICSVVLFRMVFEKMTVGYELAIFGSGIRVMLYSWTAGWAGICTALIAWVCFALGMGMWSICIGLLCSKWITVGIRLYHGHHFLDFPFACWFRRVFVPLGGVTLVTCALGLIPIFLLRASLGRVLLTTFVCEVVFLSLLWKVAMTAGERDLVVKKFLSKWRNCR